MKSSARVYSIYVLSLLLCVAAFFIINTDARKISGMVSAPQLVPKSSQDIGESSSDHSSTKITGFKHFDVFLPSDDSSNSGPYGVSSPLNLPPYDSLPPIPNTPPFCLNPPSTPQTPASGNGGGTGGDIPPPIVNPPPSPSTIFGPPDFQPNPPIIIPSPPGYFEPSPPSTIPSPTEPILSPPSSIPSPTEPILSPPSTIPSPTEPVLSPPYSYEPSPPSYIPISPPISSNIPSSPPSAFLPPVVYPPPTVPPPPRILPPTALWCVAKPSVPDPIIQEAMNYACASGAYCDQIQPNGSCFQPNTLFAHASYAFNSYWQRTKVAGGTCEFGGTAMLVTVDPSYDGCQFIFY